MAVYPDAREVARRWFEEVWNGRREEAIDELMADDSLGHVQGAEVRGTAAFREIQRTFLGAMPDVHIEIEDIIAEGDRAAVRWRVRGTHTGEHFGFEASKRAVDMRGTTWFVVKDGKTVEGWDTWDMTGMMASLR